MDPEKTTDEEEQEFLSAFSDDSAGDEARSEDIPEEAAGEEAVEEIAEEKEEPAEDPMAAVEKRIEERLAPRIRNIEGHIGGLKSTLGSLKEMMSSAKDQAHSEGAEAPSKEQIREAAQSSEKFDELKGDFPEWGEAMDEQFSLMETRLASKVKNVDVESLRKELRSELRDDTLQMVQELNVEIRHPGWAQTVNSSEFTEWAYSDGPEVAERQQYDELKHKSMNEANEFLNGLIRKYPNWWADRGALIHSPSASDAISLLDAFKTRDEETASNDDLSADRRQRKTSRLERAVAPTKGATRTSGPQSTDEDDFKSAYYGN